MAQIETPEQQIERLSAQVAQLQARLETAPQSTPSVYEPSRASLRLRAFCAALLIAIGVILAPVAVVAAWTKTEVTDQDEGQDDQGSDFEPEGKSKIHGGAFREEEGRRIT